MGNGRFGKLCLAVGLIAAGFGWGRYTIPVAHAQDASQQIGHYAIPRNWGHVAAASGNFLVLEDDQGNIHMYNFFTHQSMGDVSRKQGQ